MLAPLLLLWPLSVLLTWLVAQGLADRPFDRALGEAARAFARQVEAAAAAAPARATGPGSAFDLPAVVAETLRTQARHDLLFQVTGPDGRLLGGDARLPVPDALDVPPVGELQFRDALHGSEPVRIAHLRLEVPLAPGETPPQVQVAETLEQRSLLASEIIKGVIVPQFVILPVAVLLVWLALARGISPLNELQQRIRRRDSHDLSPIDERAAPEEVSPLVRAINDLLGRLDQSMRSQKRFIADAAHQLKTPLAGLRTQAELAQRELDSGSPDLQQVRRSLEQIALSSQRAAHMVNQLLAFARAENRSHERPAAAVALARLARESVRDRVPRALERRIDLGYEGPASDAEPCVAGHPILLRELLANLLDNALLYTPAGGSVTVRVTDDPFGQVVVLQVEDSGPGIAPAERAQVFEPFYRSLDNGADGSGLGLAIVREIAQQHAVEVELDDAQPRRRGGSGADPAAGPGARFTLRFRRLADGAAGALA